METIYWHWSLKLWMKQFISTLGCNLSHIKHGYNLLRPLIILWDSTLIPEFFHTSGLRKVHWYKKKFFRILTYYQCLIISKTFQFLNYSYFCFELGTLWLFPMKLKNPLFLGRFMFLDWSIVVCRIRPVSTFHINKVIFNVG